MKRLHLCYVAGAIVLLSACDLLDDISPFSKKRSETGVPSIENAVGNDTSVFITGISYPDGYDWKTDSLHGSVGCTLVVYSGDKCIVDVPTGEEQLVSPDMDMHRVVDGHLYTDFSTVDETVIKKDGRFLFSYSGRESICGFLVKEDSVWTLGLDRSGKGIALRCGGNIVFEDKEGVAEQGKEDSAYPTGELYLDGEDLCFCYWTALGSSKSWYIVRNGQRQAVDVSKEMTHVYDVKMIGGEVCIAGDSYSVKEDPILVTGSGKKAIGPSDEHMVKGCRIRSSGGRIYVKSYLLYAGDRVSGSVLSSQNSRQIMPGRSVKVTDFWQEGDRVAYVIVGKDNMAGPIDIDGSRFSLDGRYRLMNRKCGLLKDGHFMLGLSSYEGGHPVIWNDGTVEELPFNGYITSIGIYP